MKIIFIRNFTDKPIIGCGQSKYFGLFQCPCCEKHLYLTYHLKTPRLDVKRCPNCGASIEYDGAHCLSGEMPTQEEN